MKILILGGFGYFGSKLLTTDHKESDLSSATLFVADHNLKNKLSFFQNFNLPEKKQILDISLQDLTAEIIPAKIDLIISLLPIRSVSDDLDKVISMTKALSAPLIFFSTTATNQPYETSLEQKPQSFIEELIDQRLKEEGLYYCIVRTGHLTGLSPRIKFDSKVNNYLLNHYQQLVQPENVTQIKITTLRALTKGLNFIIKKELFNRNCFHLINNVVSLNELNIRTLNADTLEDDKINFDQKLENLGFEIKRKTFPEIASVANYLRRFYHQRVS